VAGGGQAHLDAARRNRITPPRRVMMVRRHIASRTGLIQRREAWPIPGRAESRNIRPDGWRALCGADRISCDFG
jgi:hypothetical protein